MHRFLLVPISLLGLFVHPVAAQPLLPQPSAPSTAQAGSQKPPGYLGLIANDPQDGGAVSIAEIMPGSPAEKAGLRAGDVLTRIGDRVVKSTDDIAAVLEPATIGSRISFQVDRGGQTSLIDVTLEARPAPVEGQPQRFGRIEDPRPSLNDSDTARLEAPRDPAGVAGTPRAALGIRTQPISEETRRRLGLRSAVGALVVSRNVGSPAEKAGVPLDAVIIAARGAAVNRPEDLGAIVNRMRPGDDLDLTMIVRGATTRTTVRLGEAAEPALAPSPTLAAPEPSSAARPPRLGEYEARPGVDAADLATRVEALEQKVDQLTRTIEQMNELLRQTATPPRK